VVNRTDIMVLQCVFQSISGNDVFSLALGRACMGNCSFSLGIG
jgi:hypothetical protein